jgi:hypothetical protein
VQRRDPERYLPVLQAHLARAEALTDPVAAQALIGKAEAALAQVPVPRRTQVQLGLAHAWLAVGHADNARRTARTVLQTAGSRGFRLISLEARAIMAHLSPKDEQKTHRAVGQELARDFTSGLAPDMARAFARRPFLMYLDHPVVPAAPDAPTEEARKADLTDDPEATELAPRD